MSVVDLQAVHHNADQVVALHGGVLIIHPDHADDHGQDVLDLAVIVGDGAMSWTRRI